MVHKTTLTSQQLLNLTLVVLAREAQVYQVTCRKSTCTLWSDRTITVEGVVGVDNTTQAVCRYRDTTTHMYYYEVELLIRATNLLSVATSNSLLVQGVEDRATWKLLDTANTCHILKLIHNYRVSDVSLNTCLVSNTSCNESTEVAGVLALRCCKVSNHRLAYAVNTTLDRAHKTATTNNSVQRLEVDTISLQSVEDNLQTPIQLVSNRCKTCNLLCRVAQLQGLHLLHILEQRNLCRG